MQRLRIMNKEQTEQTIREAWASAEYPGDENLAGKNVCCGEYAYVADYFRGRHWQDLTLEHLLEHYEGPHYACMSFMSAAAYVYYLGAMMLIAMADPEDTLGDSIVFGLRQWWDDPRLESHMTSPTQELAAWTEARWGGFTEPQRRAIVAYLEYTVALYAERGWDDPQPAEALEFWRAMI